MCVTLVLCWSSKLAPSLHVQQWSGTKEYKVQAAALLVLGGALTWVICQLSHGHHPPCAEREGELQQCSAYFPFSPVPYSTSGVGRMPEHILASGKVVWEILHWGLYIAELDMLLLDIGGTLISLGKLKWGVQIFGEAFGVVIDKTRCQTSSDTFIAGQQLNRRGFISGF